MGKYITDKYSPFLLFILSFGYFLFTIKQDIVFFDYEGSLFSNKFYIFTKFISMFVIFFIWQIPYIIWKQYKKDKERTLFNIKLFSVYFVILLSILLMISPGIFTGDERTLLTEVMKLEIGYWHYWYHIISSVLFYTVFLEIFHSQLFLSIVQICLVSFFVSYIITQLFYCYKTKLIFLLFIPFLLPSTIELALCPARMSIYSFLFVFFIFSILIKYNKILKDKDVISHKNIFLCALISSILICYRGEGFVLIIALPIGLHILFKNLAKVKQFIIYFLYVSLISTLIILVQNTGNISKKYININFAFEIERMLNQYENLKITDEQKNIVMYYVEKSLDEDKTINADELGEKLPNDFYKIYISLVKQNFVQFINYRYGLMRASKYIHGDDEILKEHQVNELSCSIVLKDNKCIKYQNDFVENFHKVEPILFLFLWNLIFALIFREKFYIFSLILLLSNFIVVFLISPVAFFDYYFSFYLGNICLFIHTIAKPWQIKQKC